eukprot:c38460_g1_i1 orf=2-202(-)
MDFYLKPPYVDLGKESCLYLGLLLKKVFDQEKGNLQITHVMFVCPYFLSLIKQGERNSDHITNHDDL